MAGNTVWTIKKLINWTTQFFRNHDIETPRLDAELLLSHVLHKSRIYLYTDFDLIVNPSELAQYREYIKKRINGFSTAAIIGEKEFMGVTLNVNEHVLIPRPDTETWLEKVIQYHRNKPGLKVLDLGTGSGAILLSFLYFCREDTGLGIDISEEALEVARKNSRNLKLDDRVEWRKGDFLTALGKDEVFDGILTNPPYIPSAEIHGLEAEVLHEPHLALDGGPDGLDFYRRLAADSATYLKSGGFLAAEFGINQSGAVLELLKSSNQFDSFEIIMDYGSIARAVYCRKK